MADTGQVLFASVQPTSYLHVSASAAANGDGSLEHPFNTIQQAVDAATAGTAIMVGAGVYHENVKLPSVSPGTPTAPIWLISSDGQGAAKIVPPSSTESAIYGYGTDNFIIKNFAIDGGDNGIEFTQSGKSFTNLVHNILIEGNIVSNTVEDGIKVSQANNIQVLGNTVSTTGTEGVDFLAVNNSLIDYNDVSHASGSAGIMVKGGSTNVTIDANNVHDIPKMDGILVGGYTQAQYFVPGYTGYEAKNVTVTGNQVSNVAKQTVNVLGAINSTITGNYLEADSNSFWAVSVNEGDPKAQTVAHSTNVEIADNIITNITNPNNSQRVLISSDSLDISVHGNSASGTLNTPTGPSAMPASGPIAGLTSGGQNAGNTVPAITADFSLAPDNYYVTLDSDGSYTVQGPDGTQTVAADANAAFSATSQTLSMTQFMAQEFNPLEYIASNTDLIPYIGDNQTAALEHYILHGYAEGRQTTSFNALEYTASNTDLIQYIGDNQTAALEHYILHGYSEGRQTASFNALEYIASNPDLIPSLGDNQTAALEEYIQQGYGQGRPTTSFNVLEYVASNPDLAKAWGSANASLGLEHYILHGYAEGRSTDSFDAVAYLLSNPDLQNGYLTAQTALLHYVDHGVDEGRSPSGAFGTEQTQHALTLGTSLADTIGTSGDEDWFSVNLTAGQNYSLSLSGAGSASGTLADPRLELHNANGVLLTSNNDGGPGHDALISFTAPTTGLYYLVAAANSSTATGTYKILAAVS